MRGQYSSAGSQSVLWTRILLALAALILIILIGKFIGGSSSTSMENAVASLRLPDSTSSAQIIDADNKQKDVNANTPLASLDFIEVKNGTSQVVILSNPKNVLTMNTGTKLRYLGSATDGKSQFRLENKDLWVQSDTADITLDLVGVTLIPASTTVLNVSKNELFTTITVLQGSATVTLGGSSQEITSGKQLNYSSLKTLTVEEISSRIVPINPDALATDWMKSNGATAYLPTVTTPGITTTPSNTSNSGSLILFESPVDESTVESKTVTVSGRILSANVARVVINNAPATVDPAKQTFTLAGVALTAKENNIVYRTYDVTGTLLSKGVVTVYTTAPGVATTTTNPTGSVRAQVETYKPDNRFRIISPSTDFFETRETKVKIEGRVTANVAHHITINDFRLGSFAVNGTSWYYFANQQFGNMQEGVNTYTIRYFDAEDNEIYKQLFVIKKLSPVVRSVSGEVSR